MKRLFHKRDGGLIKLRPDRYYFHSAYCSMCGAEWGFLGDKEAARIAMAKSGDLVSYNDLSENLQSVALVEML